MASKKYTWILGLLGLVQSATFAQKNDANADWWKDSSKVATKNLPQHNEFMNNQYPYPSRPRDQWELGFSAGLGQIFGDVDPRFGYGGGLSLRKSLGHVFSLRAEYIGTINKGLDYRARFNGNGIWAGYGNAPYYANYQTRTHQFSLDAIASLNTISNYRGNPKSSIYVLAGYSFLAADVDVDAVDANNQPYNFSTIANDPDQSRKNIKSKLKDLLDGKYDSNGPVPNGSRDAIGRYQSNTLLRHALDIGGGIAFKLSPRVSLGIEQKFTLPIFAGGDDFDGINAGRTNDVFSYTSIRGGINLGSSAKRVAPLWWINPNNFIYNELNAPKHMKIPTPVLPDADGDGVTDQFDQEPNTPAGAPVDSHGVAKDSDGDGVPDYKDKELLTPQKCFPVNADGVGNCPEPECCKELRDKIANMKVAPDCGITDLPSVQFKKGSVNLSKDAIAVLASAAEKINANPNCKVKLIGYGSSDKRAQQLSWDRVNAVKNYLIEKQGISESRLLFFYGQEGDANTVDLQGTTEDGPNTVPAPHPNLKRTK